MSHIYTLLFKLLKNCDRYLKPPYNITKISLTHNIEQFKKIIINLPIELYKENFGSIISGNNFIFNVFFFHLLVKEL